MNTKEKVKALTFFAIMLAIETLFCFTILGQIPIGPIVMTLGMIPVIITSLYLGPLFGSIMGFIAGLYSLIYFSFVAPGAPTSFVFSPFVNGGNFLSLIVCFIPRILTGLFPALIYFSAIKKNSKHKRLWLIIASVVGSLTSTILVLGGMGLFFASSFGEEGVVWTIIGTTILTNGLPEAALAGLISPIVIIAIESIKIRKID